MKFLIFLLSFNLLAKVNIIPEKDASGSIININDAFSSKHNYNFRGNGTTCNVAAYATTNCDFTMPYAHAKFNGISIFNSKLGDKANLKIIDTPAGTYSTVPNAMLNQFGFNWNLGTNTKELLPYPSDLYTGMIIRVEFINSDTTNDVYINYYLHEAP